MPSFCSESVVTAIGSPPNRAVDIHSVGLVGPEEEEVVVVAAVADFDNQIGRALVVMAEVSLFVFAEGGGIVEADMQMGFERVHNLVESVNVVVVAVVEGKCTGPEVEKEKMRIRQTKASKGFEWAEEEVEAVVDSQN
jgi:hypothetical protein